MFLYRKRKKKKAIHQVNKLRIQATSIEYRKQTTQLVTSKSLIKSLMNLILNHLNHKLIKHQIIILVLVNNSLQPHRVNYHRRTISKIQKITKEVEEQVHQIHLKVDNHKKVMENVEEFLLRSIDKLIENFI